MDSISALLGEMHAQALAMNAEVKGRADQLDNLVDTSLRQNTNLKGAVKQTANVGMSFDDFCNDPRAATTDGRGVALKHAPGLVDSAAPGFLS